MNPAEAHSDAGSAQDDPSLGPGLARIAHLERMLAVREKTIKVLIARQLEANVPQTTMLNTLEQSISLEKVVASGMISAFAAATDEADLDFMREQIPMALDQSIDGIARIATIVKAMKNFSHSSGEVIQPENLETIVRTAVIVSQNEWKSVADLKIEVAPGLPLVPCLRDEIGQLVLNLVVNSAHAISERKAQGDPSDGHITITIACPDQNAELRFTDNGAGIPEAIRNRVFDPFFTTKPVGVGTGQGLAIAYSTVVERHHGQITLESEVGLGTCFLVRLPLHPAAPSGAQRPS
jgi:signal transduction histidine kinase